MWYLVRNSYKNFGGDTIPNTTPIDWKVVNILSYTFLNIYIMAHLLCAEEYWFIWVTVMEFRSALKSKLFRNVLNVKLKSYNIFTATTFVIQEKNAN